MPESFALSLGGLHVRWERPSGTEARLLLEGELDNLSVPVLNQALDSLYKAGCTDVTFDLIDLGFVDSSGLGALVGAWRHCQEVGGSARAIHPSLMVQRLMDVTGISRFLLGR
jgi:anti-sigma B factor antagonist